MIFILKKKFKYRINRQIRTNSVRLIDENGTQIGIVPLEKALEEAEKKGLDLVEIAPHSNPPVCKIMEYSKFLYLHEKREKESRKHQRLVHLKEIRIKPRIDKHDLEIKLKKIDEFIEEGHKVKVSLMFKGREKEHKELGRSIIDTIKQRVVDKVHIEQEKEESSRIILSFSPLPHK